VTHSELSPANIGHFDWKLISVVIAIIVAARFAVTYALGVCVNPRRLQILSWKHLFVMSYGGLRQGCQIDKKNIKEQTFHFVGLRI
jgi:hypothetical protein